MIFAFTDTEKGEKKKIPAEEGREGRGENRLSDDDDEEGCEGLTFSPLATLGGPHKNPFFSPFSNGGPLAGYSMYVCLSGLLQAAARGGGYHAVTTCSEEESIILNLSRCDP